MYDNGHNLRLDGGCVRTSAAPKQASPVGWPWNAVEGAFTMANAFTSEDRILTTHAGALSCAPSVLDLIRAKASDDYDPEAYAATVTATVLSQNVTIGNGAALSTLATSATR